MTLLADLTRCDCVKCPCIFQLYVTLIIFSHYITCVCGKAVDARGLHGLACRRSAPRQQRHSHLYDIIWRAMKRAQIPAVKEPVGLMRQDGQDVLSHDSTFSSGREAGDVNVSLER